MNRIFRISILLAMVLFCGIIANASLADVRALLDSHNYADALRLAVSEIDAKPKGSEVGRLQACAGEACLGMGNLAQAREWFMKAKSKNVNEAWLGLARVDMLQYRFDEAAENYAKYKGPEASQGREEASLATDFMGRVQKLAIVDTICVDADGFFRNYKIAGASLDTPVEGVDGKVMFTNEAGDMRLYSKRNKQGYLKPVRADHLLNGEWEESHVTFGAQGDDDDDTDDDFDDDNDFDIDYLYMLGDGTTLYLAHNGPGGIGGYDIYIANGEPLSNRFMNPGNIGMPFNSPANDYMLAIGEDGLGWWATDRNHPAGDKVTIYIFRPSDMRYNWPVDSPDVKAYARGQLWLQPGQDADQ